MREQPEHPIDRRASRPGEAARRLAAIPVRTAGGEDACAAAEPFALRVLGDAMLPEFAEGDIIIIEPEGLAREGSFVLAWWEEEWTFRQLVRDGGQWFLAALDPGLPRQALPDLSPVRGVVIQKSTPGHRRSLKRYGD
ncbi:MAG: response transcriptional repressor, RecA-mediated autopeptidase [Rhodocyclaceae bacterium]|nr:response transcriptional repressor, RecA-mediated autopeptidase [Rhodocyclaceae bacterium]